MDNKVHRGIKKFMKTVNDFYTIDKCQRCQSIFNDSNRRIQSWFNDDLICSSKCNRIEKSILEALGNKASQFEDCGFVPDVLNKKSHLRNSFTNTLST